MTKTCTAIATVVLLGLLLGVAQAQSARTYRSPDGTLIATVLAKGKSPAGPKESVVEIRRAGELLARGDYTSDDGEHGLIVEKVAWTSDSQFFIFMTSSSGGHQPWQSPAFFFSVADRQVHSFSEYLPAVAEPAFSVKKPDLVTMIIWTPLNEKRNMTESIMLPITFKMSDLLRPQK